MAGVSGAGGGSGPGVDLLSAGLSAFNPLLGEGLKMGMQLLTGSAGGGGGQGGASGKPGEDVHPTLERFNG